MLPGPGEAEFKPKISYLPTTRLFINLMIMMIYTYPLA